MKKLTTEQKAKAYDEALKRAREWHNDPHITIGLKGNLEDIFPELKESEDVDKKIREEIIATIHLYYGKPLEDEAKEMIAWLEKQGEQPSAIRWYDVSLIPQEMEELLVEWDSDDTTWHEIAFYHADTSTFWNGTRQVDNVTRWCYIIDLLEKQGEQKPYGQKKECLDCQFNYAGECKGSCQMKRDEQKPTWSEEDEKMLHNIEYCVHRCVIVIGTVDKVRYIDWLKSLKQRIGGKV